MSPADHMSKEPTKKNKHGNSEQWKQKSEQWKQKSEQWSEQETVHITAVPFHQKNVSWICCLGLPSG